MDRVPWLCFQVLVSRLGPLDTREFVLWHVHTILVHELVRSKVGWKMFRVHALDGFIGKDAASHRLLVYLLDTIKFLGEVFVEAATEGLLGLLWMKIDGKKPNLVQPNLPTRLHSYPRLPPTLCAVVAHSSFFF